MISVKELKSVDLASYTKINTIMGVIFALIASILFSIILIATTPGGLGISLYVISTLVVGSFMYAIYNAFCQGWIYNLLAKKIKTIKFVFDGEKLIKVTTTETAIVTAMILTIQVILIYLVSVMIVPLIISTSIQTLLFSGQQTVAYSLYQIMIILSQPATIAMIIFGSFIVTFVFTLLACYIYNLLASKGKGIELKLSEENNLTAIESVNMMKFAIVVAIISGVLSIISAIVMIISGGPALNAILNIISSFIGGFIIGALVAIIYNFVAQKSEKLKLELIDLKTN